MLPLHPVSMEGCHVALDPGMHVASLRYFETRGPFAEAVQHVLGVTLPDTLRATSISPGVERTRAILAWRRPTEALLLAFDQTPIAQIDIATAGLVDGCVIDLTGGMLVYRASGTRLPELLARLGDVGGAPAVGESRTGRFAGVTVVVVRLDLGETFLIVERTYAEHLMGWIRASAGDWERA